MHRSFDVLLLDISMPEVSGIELLDQLTAHGRLTTVRGFLYRRISSTR